ncbi:deoxyribodipyrimidine photolyase-related protein [Litoreibacter halocynthiae]|uniref:Deoxyribodipyrimidine photolyase-related protein n=1 Tax=Litoreibacter halocynthiae TaxID=1242689 RepID=A0A4R7LHJ1_9RHOB|nr:cryptochrome/photolyase family protein [Litoreibacter halocynthiae]TDT73986.1 deoxyribodipyrimidine photolyase-related protein [Litoreibacter halocynthiae]
MVSRLVLVLGDQLSPNLSALQKAEKDTDIIVMAEVADEASYVPHHPKKIAFIFAAMRKFADALRNNGWQVDYTKLDDPDNAGSITGELLRRAEQHDASGVIATEPGEWRLIEALQEMPLKLHMISDTRFIASHKEFEDWAEGRKELRMEWFYRDMRRKTGLLMDGDKPVEGKWNFDHDNRKPAPDDVDFHGPMQFTPDETVEEVLDLVEQRFGDNFGTLRPFWFATDTGQARRQLTHWIKHALPQFGDFQDAMLNDNRFLYHSIISFHINAGLLDPLEVCEQVEQAYKDGHAPINAAEGFIRQIIGWREYMRGIYFLEGPDYTSRNALKHSRTLPSFFWDADTKMNCVAKTVAQTRDEAYAHHIQRLMVTGNFALLAGIDPHEVHEWYLAVYADAYEWVEAPNVIGMSQFADGGIVGSKPYVSSGAYIDRMSDYCKHCEYKVKDKTGPEACPFNLLYWDFLIRHRERFSNNPRMGNMYRTWDRMDESRKEAVLSDARVVLKRLDLGESI